MLTPDELAKLQEHLVPLYQELEDFIIEDIARRLKKTGQVTDMAKWQIEMANDIAISMKKIEEEVARINGIAIEEVEKLFLKKTGQVTDMAKWQIEMANDIAISMKKIEEEVARINGIAIEEVEKLFNEAALTSLDREISLYEKAGMSPLTLDNSPLMKQYLEAAIKQTEGELRNITGSLGFAQTVGGKITYQPIAKVYHNALDLAQFQISSGVLDYNTAVKRAVKSLCDSGVRFVDYESGWSNRVDVAVRRATVTGGNQMATKMTEANIEHLGISYVETTAHAGARPDHQNWQGQVFCYKGKDMRYPDFVETTRYGHGDGICGWNCRHTFHPFIPNVSARAYSDADLERIKELDEKIIEYNDKSYNLYQATQKQRQIETAIRKTKRELIAYNASELKDEFSKASIKLQRQKQYYKNFSKAADLPLQAIRKTKRELIAYNASELKDEFSKASIKLQRQKQYYKNFSKAADLPLQNERHQVLDFNRSVAQKAIHAAKRGSKK